MSALLIAGQNELAQLGNVVEYGTTATILALVCSIVFAAVARFASWRTPAWLRSDKTRPDLDVGASLTALRCADDIPAIELRSRALDHWNARAESAWRLGQLKYAWLKRAALALSIPLFFLVIVAIALLA
jgi:hypothetical protein